MTPRGVILVSDPGMQTHRQEDAGQAGQLVHGQPGIRIVGRYDDLANTPIGGAGQDGRHVTGEGIHEEVAVGVYKVHG